LRNNRTVLVHEFIWRMFFLLAVLIVVLVTGPLISVAEEKKEEKNLVGKTVNINTATLEEFMEVPLITKELAERIVEYREETGDFQVLEELLQVEGFTRELLRKIDRFLLLDGIGGDECSC
jgi:competence ComEA-like helix-hairpin-helix protein